MIHAQLAIKPESANRSWKSRVAGKRVITYSTREFRAYKLALSALLPPAPTIGLEAPLRLAITWGIAQRVTVSDLDNWQKPFIDALADQYGFNDRQIWELHVRKVRTKDWLIDFRLERMPDGFDPTQMRCPDGVADDRFGA